ncbi:MAG: DinB family protein [Methylocystis sp.]|uniref:DinB family protein n=1 Tax=Methylocystis sp. TaxID=1911079 RepID=UPI003DA5F3EB
MSDCKHIVLMASYNAWMNDKVYEAAGRLNHAEITRNRGAFFGSILGTLNHIAVADTIWLRRFAAHPSGFAALTGVRDVPAPPSLDTPLFAELAGLAAYRKTLDGIIQAWASELAEDDLSRILSYTSMKGIAAQKRLAGVIMHFFNHQTHHRGQVTTLLLQAGEDVGVTDLIALIPDEVLI